MFSKIKDLLIDLLFPRRCPVCGDIVLPKGELICPECFKKLVFVREPVCKKCGKPLASQVAEYCMGCARHRRSFEYGVALVVYNEAARDSVIKIKYKNKREYLDFYSEAVAACCGRRLLRMNADALVPVPVHAARRRQRGYNQAEILAKGIGRHLGIPVRSSILVRNKNTAPQKKLDPGQRLKNLEQAFAVGEIPAGVKRVILVDDIYTTGSTIEACTRVLKRAGIEQVYFVVICIVGGE